MDATRRAVWAWSSRSRDRGQRPAWCDTTSTRNLRPSRVGLVSKGKHHRFSTRTERNRREPEASMPAMIRAQRGARHDQAPHRPSSNEHPAPRGAARPAFGRRRRSRAVAGRDPRHGAAAAAGRRLDRACWKAATARRWSCCTARGVRGPLDAGDPGSGDDPSRGRPRPARPRRLGGRRRPAGRRPRARVARRADRAAPARRRPRWWATGSAAPSRPASRSTTPTGSAGWCWWTRSAWPRSSRRRSSGSP